MSLSRSGRIVFYAVLYLVISLNIYAAGFEILTYNTGLAHGFVAHAQKRIEYIAKELGKLQSDVLCLQEVWRDDDRDYLIGQLKKDYPHSFYIDKHQIKTQKTPACGVMELFGKNKFGRCMAFDCRGKAGEEYTNCLLNNCGNALNELKTSNIECLTSLMAQIGKNPIMAIFAVINPFFTPGLFAYEGSTGLLVLSKEKMERQEEITLADISTINQRTALAFEIEKGIRHKVVCTHLTPLHGKEIPYVGKLASWENENREQVVRLLKKTSRWDGAIYLAGDFNCSIGNEKTGIASEMRANCQLFHSSRFEDPVFSAETKCTFCKDNEINRGGKDVVIDHIFVKNVNPSKVEIVMKDKVVPVDDDKQSKIPLSDHYGVRLLVHF